MDPVIDVYKKWLDDSGRMPVFYDLGFVTWNYAIKPKQVIYNDPATIVYWSDGTKTVVRCHEGDVFDRREGFLLCCAKRLMGNKGSYNDVMRWHCPNRHDEVEA